MKLKKEYAIIVLVIIGLSLYIYSRTSDRINYELPQPDPVNTKEVTRISLYKQGKVLTLARENGQWTAGQKGYPASTGSIENLLEALDRFRISDLVSRSKNYARYSLDQESAIEVKAWAGRDLVRSFRVGKQASTYRNSYVKLADDPNIYLSMTNMKQALDKELDDFQDKVVLRFDEKKLQKIVIQVPGDSLSLTREKDRPGQEEDGPEEPRSTGWLVNGDKEVDTLLVDTLFQSIDGLTCSSYLEHRQKQDFHSPDYRLTLLNGQEDVLSLYLDKEQENVKRYRGTSKENRFPFVLSRQKGKKIVEALNSFLNL